MRRRWLRWTHRQVSRLAIVHVNEPRSTIVPSGLVEQSYRRRLVLVDRGPWL